MACYRLPLFRCSVAFVAIACMATAASATAPFAYLDQSWQTQLKSLPIPVVIPRQLLPGFRLTHFKGKSYPTHVAGKSVTRATYELDFQKGSTSDITLFVTDENDSPYTPPHDPTRAPFSVTSPGAGTLHFVAVKLPPRGSGWQSDTVRIDEPRGAHPTYLFVDGGADKAAFQQFAASLVRFAH